MDVVPPPQHASVSLLHALIAQSSRDFAFRYVVIKGPTLARQGIRPHRESSDLDLMIAPAEFGAALHALETLGWRARDQATDIGVEHSITLFHECWHPSIDVHLYYPGILASREVAFDFIFDRSVIEVFAGRPVRVADPLTNTVIILLHSLRSPGTRDHDRELVQALERASEFSTVELRAVIEGLDAGSPLADVLAENGIVAGLSSKNVEAARAWRLRRQTRTRLGAYLDRVQSSDLVDVPHELWRAVWPSRAQLSQEHPERSWTRSSSVRFRAMRILKGLREMWSVVRSSLRTGSR